MFPTDVMVDIETMGSGADAAVVSIGAVAFPRTGAWTPKREVDWRETFYLTIDLKDAAKHGGTVDADTIRWWLQQSDAARQALFEPTPRGVREVLLAFGDFLCRVGGHPERKGHELSQTLEPDWKFPGCVWAWPPSFDLVILGNLLREMRPYEDVQRVRHGSIWRRRSERDARTLCMEAGTLGVDAAAPKLSNGTDHRALDDAIAQAVAVRRALAGLREPVTSL